MSVEELARLSSEYDVKNGWTRELMIPSYIPLHFLHYIIQRAYGFENKADHLFQLPEELFSSITEDDLRNYCRLCGVLFRFPYGNDSEILWDDDFDGKKSIKSWLKEKYEGKWNTSGGTGYGYTDNQYRIWQWLGDKVEDFHKYVVAFDAEDYYDALERLGAPEEYSIGEMDGAGIPEAGQFPFNNVLESLNLEDVLCKDPEKIGLWNFEDGLESAESELLDGLITLEKAREAMKEAQEIYKLLERQMKAGRWDEDVLLVKRWREAAKNAAELFVFARGGSSVPYPFTKELVYLYDFGKRKGLPMEGEPKWKIKITVLEEYYDYSIYYSRNYMASDATGARFMNDPEHAAEMADRLHAMCYWKEKLEVIDSQDRWIRPSNATDMMITLRPEQELLPEERAEIEKRRREFEDDQEEREEIVDDVLYKALREVMLNRSPVCLAKEGMEPGEGYPEVKIRNTSVEKLV